MGIDIFTSDNGASAVFVCNTTGHAFGPTISRFDAGDVRDSAEEFLAWLTRERSDPRDFDRAGQLEAIVTEWCSDARDCTYCGEWTLPRLGTSGCECRECGECGEDSTGRDSNGWPLCSDCLALPVCLGCGDRIAEDIADDEDERRCEHCASAYRRAMLEDKADRCGDDARDWAKDPPRR